MRFPKSASLLGVAIGLFITGSDCVSAESESESGWKVEIPGLEKSPADRPPSQWEKILQPNGSLIGKGQTDVFAHGYFRPSNSVSPDGHYAVLVPMFAVMGFGPCFLVDLHKRTIIGSIDVEDYATWLDPRSVYTWSVDGSSMVMALGHRTANGCELKVLRGVTIDHRGLRKQIDLLRELDKSAVTSAKREAWLAGESSFGADGLATIEVWKKPANDAPMRRQVLWDPAQGKVQFPPAKRALNEVDDPGPRADMVSNFFDDGKPATGSASVMARSPDGFFYIEVGPNTPLTAVSTRDPEVRVTFPGIERRLQLIEPGSGAGLSDLLICFISPDSKYVFVNHVIFRNLQTGEQSRTGHLFRRVGENANDELKFEPATKDRLDIMAWKHFAKREKLSELQPSVLDEPASHNRSVYFYGWSDASNRLLLYLRGRRGKAPGYYRSFECFGLSLTGRNEPMSFETHDSGPFVVANRALRSRWNVEKDPSAFFDFPPEAHQTFGDSQDAPSKLENEADADLNVYYSRLMEKLPPAERDGLRDEQRSWIQQRETIAWVHAVQSWSPYPRGRLAEGRAAATGLRAEQLAERLRPLVAGANTVIREKSPDGVFGVRYHCGDDDLKQQFPSGRVEVLELATEKVVMKLYDREEEGESPVDISVLWAPDSRRFAWRRSFKRFADTSVYERVEDGFERCEMPSLDEFYPKLGKWNERKFLSGDDAPQRWTNSNHLIIARKIAYLGESESGGVGPMIVGDYEILLRIGKDRKATIEKVLSRKVRAEPFQ